MFPRVPFRFLFRLIFLLLALAACQNAGNSAGKPHLHVHATGFINPVGLAALPDGTLFVAEEGTGLNDDSAGISLVLPDGQVSRYISNLPSSRDSGDLSGAPLVALSPDNQTLYIGHFNQHHLWTYPLPEVIAPLAQPLTQAGLTPAMQPKNRVQLINPFDMTFDRDGVPVVSDASANGVAKELPDGTTRFFHQFFEIPDPTHDKRLVDPVPTGITRVGAEYYVTLLGGCPYPAGAGQLVAIDENRQERPLLTGLNMPIDVAQGPDGTIWVLEFARFSEGGDCFTGADYLPHSGRLSRLGADGALEPVLTELNFPAAVLPRPDGSLLISEIFAGRVLALSFERLKLGEEMPAFPLSAPALLGETITPLADTAPDPTPTSPATSWRFRNVATRVGLTFRHSAFQYGLHEDPVAMMGGGLCWIDYNNDGWLDLYLVNSYAGAEQLYWQLAGGLPTNALYENREGFFQDVSQASGAALSLRGNGCVAADFNLDGWTDLYITADGPDRLLWNQGDGTFAEGAENAGISDPEWNTAAAVGDLNGDGWPDLYVASYINLRRKIDKPSGAFPQDYLGLPDHLYLNLGPDGSGRVTFRDVASAVGLTRQERGLGAVLTDADSDGDLDLYIANDGHPNRLYENQQAASPPGFQLVDLTDSADVGDSGSGMGVASGDYDGDGRFDLAVTNWEVELNAIYQNDTESGQPIHYRYSTFRLGMAGLGRNLTGWGVQWADFDHDTDNDLLVTNGRVPITNPNADRQLVRFYANQTAQGRRGELRDGTALAGLERVGPLLGRGSAAADYDNDGDLDLAINVIGGAMALLRNEGGQQLGHWLQVGFAGFWPGTTVTVTLPDGRQLRREWLVGSSYLASEDPRLHFGLGAAERLPALEVRFPDGQTKTFQNVAVDRLLLVRR